MEPNLLFHRSVPLYVRPSHQAVTGNRRPFVPGV